MKSPINRREFVVLSGGIIAGAALTRATSGHDSSSHAIPRFDVPLPIPRVLEPLRTDGKTDYYEIVQREACVEIVPGRHTTIWGYDGTFPGPTIKARRGRTVIVRHVNRLGTPTVVHLHGGVTPPDSDGFPMDHVMPGETREYVYPRSLFTIFCQSVASLCHCRTSPSGSNNPLRLTGVVEASENQLCGGIGSYSMRQMWSCSSNHWRTGRSRLLHMRELWNARSVLAAFEAARAGSGKVR